MGIDTYVYYLLATCLYLNSSDRLPDRVEVLRTGETDGTHKPRWQPLGYLSRKLRNKSILLQASLFLHRLRTWSSCYYLQKPDSLGGTREYHNLSILIAVVYWTIVTCLPHTRDIAVVIFCPCMILFTVFPLRHCHFLLSFITCRCVAVVYRCLCVVTLYHHQQPPPSPPPPSHPRSTLCA